MKKAAIATTLVIFFACSEAPEPLEPEVVIEVPVLPDSVLMEPLPIIAAQALPEPTNLEWSCLQAGLRPIHEFDDRIVTELRYSTDQNFLGKDVYGEFEKGYIRPEYGPGLARAQAELHDLKPGFCLVIYDAVRPRGVQQQMWDILDMPIEEKVRFVSNPRNGSLHNFGAAVDVSILDSTGQALDMGTGWDDASTLSYPRFEQAYLDSGMLTPEIIDNRKLLRRVMRKGGFWNIQTEWWHFNAVRRDTAKKYFLIVE